VGFGVRPDHDPHDMLGIVFPAKLFAMLIRKVTRGRLRSTTRS